MPDQDTQFQTHLYKVTTYNHRASLCKKIEVFINFSSLEIKDLLLTYNLHLNHTMLQVYAGFLGFLETWKNWNSPGISFWTPGLPEGVLSNRPCPCVCVSVCPSLNISETAH